MQVSHTQNQNDQPKLIPFVQPENDFTKIPVLDEEALSKFVEVIEQKVYQRLLKKAIKYKLMGTLKQYKVINSEDQFHYQQYLDEINQTLKSNADTLQKWILFNILSKSQLTEMKKHMFQVNQRKARKAAEIEVLVQKIGLKQQDKKVSEAIQKFNRIRKANKKQINHLDQIRQKNEQIKLVLEKVNQNDFEQIKKAAQQINEYNLNLEKSTTITLDKLDKLLL